MGDDVIFTLRLEAYIPMQTIQTINKLRSIIKQWRMDNHTIALVPTMGNLHQGHLKLIEKAKEVADKVIVSIFVNPLQFGPNEDLANYPRTHQQDSLQLVDLNVNLLFAPLLEEIYPQTDVHALEQQTFVEVPQLSTILCGQTRPNHFRGVTTIVNKLFNLTQPDFAIFGEKDFQQLTIIRKMVADTNIPVEIIGVPIVRESDGLAISSRNQYLSAEERLLAPQLYKTLQQIAKQINHGNQDLAGIQKYAKLQLTKSGFNVDYIEILQVKTLQHALNETKECIALAAAYLGKTRLIDNLRL